MRIQLLGPVQLRLGDAVVEVGPAQRCLVLAALAADAGRLVSREVLVDRVWGQSPPGGAWRTAQTHVSLIRGALTRAGAPAQAVLVHRGGGYLLDVAPDIVDVHRLRSLTARATDNRQADTGRLTMWREAVGLWRGEPLSGLGGDWVTRTRDVWHGEYREAVLGWAYAEFRAGDPTTTTGPLVELVDRYPLVEAVSAMLMRALYATGRRSEALDCYTAIRQRLDAELAETPGPELQAVYQAILRREPAPPPPSGAVPAGTAVPAQLPADVRGFAGRTDHLAQLDTIAATVGEDAAEEGNATAVVISAIAGTAGVGKTALAVHWAHRAAKRFPDGQVYVNLRGFDPGGTAVDPADAIRGLLDALAVPAERVPADRDAQASLYRTLVADKRMLIVLDNARDSGQVRPLLPGAPGCLVLVTSRNRLTSLIATTGAHPLPLDLLTSDEARDLLTRRLGPHRVAAEPDAIEALITHCAYLPLALALVAARAATHPQLSLAALATELHGAGKRLDTLADDDPTTDLRTVFSWSYTTLTTPAGRLFRLLGLHPGPDISTPAAASLAALPAHQTWPLLAELTTASLIAECAPGRYTFHDLLRAYAADLAHHTDPADQRHTATRRLLDHYLHTAYTADRLVTPTRDPITLAPALPGTAPEHPATYREALDWFTTEHAVLLAAVKHAAVTGLNLHTWQLSWSLASYLDVRGHWHDQVAVGLGAVAAAEHLTNPTVQATAHRALAGALLNLGRHAEARGHLGHALDQARRADDLAGQAHVHYVLTHLEERLGHHTEALHHANHAIDLYTTTGHRPGLARTLNNAAFIHAHLGDHHLALTYGQQALTTFEEIGDATGQAITWDSLGYIHHHLGNHTQAVTCYQHAIAVHRDLGDRYYEADSLTSLGDTHHTTGNHTAAHAAWQQALTILDDIQHPDADKLRAKVDQLNRPDS